MRGNRDGVKVDWDISPVPASGGLPARAAIVSRDQICEHPEADNEPYRVRCLLPDLRVEDRRLDGPHHLHQPPRGQNSQIDTFLVLNGAIEATLDGTTRTLGPGTLISVPRGTPCMLRQREPEPAHILSFHTPNSRPAGQRERNTPGTRSVRLANRQRGPAPMLSTEAAVPTGAPRTAASREGSRVPSA